MPNPKPVRAESPRHLDPPGVRLERALLARAEAIETTGIDAVMDLAEKAALRMIAAEWRKLANELHYWLWRRSSSAPTSPARSASKQGSTSPATPTSSSATRSRSTSRYGHRP
jgi:hypothetical protein